MSTPSLRCRTGVEGRYRVQQHGVAGAERGPDLGVELVVAVGGERKDAAGQLPCAAQRADALPKGAAGGLDGGVDLVAGQEQGLGEGLVGGGLAYAAGSVESEEQTAGVQALTSWRAWRVRSYCSREMAARSG